MALYPELEHDKTFTQLGYVDNTSRRDLSQILMHFGKNLYRDIGYKNMS